MLQKHGAALLSEEYILDRRCPRAQKAIHLKYCSIIPLYLIVIGTGGLTWSHCVSHEHVAVSKLYILLTSHLVHVQD